MVQNLNDPREKEADLRRATSRNRPLLRPDFTLDDKYTQTEGLIVLSGIHALVRVPLDQYRADQARGLNTATFISGYRGSPLGGLDMSLLQAQKIMESHHVRFMPAVNEDLGATAVFGSQIANLLPNPRYDGVLGMWYGKAPGLDRSGDAIRHANFAGVGRYGGVLALAGDDPNAKSSTIPSASENTLYDTFMPVVFPGNVQEVLDYGRLGFELSRYSGLWVGFKVVTNVADEFSSAEVSPDRISIQDPGFTYRGQPWKHNQSVALLTPHSLAMEREILEGRLEAARLFGTANQMNQITLRTGDDWIGIAAAGKTYYDVRQAFRELGLSDEDLQRYGIRLLKIGLLAPMDPALIREFAYGLEELLVIEEKRPFIELYIRDALYNLTDRPRVLGKRDENDKPLVAIHGELDSDDIAQVLAKRLRRHVDPEQLDARVKQITASNTPITIPLINESNARTPYYCSGCPHNSSTVVPEGSLAGAGIGCHTMAILMDRNKDNTVGLTQMGGEGVQWVGASLFSDMPHMFQNLGDGTLFHSGTMAIRQSVAAGVNITYKILWNSAVAMTGGQELDGELTLWGLTQLLRSEKVGRIIITTPDPDSYPPDAEFAKGVEIWHRDRLEEAQLALRETPGVTALIHDQECAAELRRKRRRGLAPEPELRVFINEAVCEGCGDCGVKSNCLSVFPVETEFGRKTQIHQSSCNKDYSCLKGHCPAFITVIPNMDEVKQSLPHFEEAFDLPEPVLRTRGESNIYMMGIGGTGVVTTNQIVATAALLDGKQVTSLDQTGLSQKGGPVVSNMRIIDEPADISNKISAASADCYLVFDLLSGSDYKNLTRAMPGRTVAVVSTSEVPTGSMITDVNSAYPGTKYLLKAVDDATSPGDNVYFDAVGLSETLFGSHMPANIMMVGAAYQLGLIPISAAAIERAIELNGVAVKANKMAFRVGRRVVTEPDWVTTIKPKRAGDLNYEAPPSPQARRIIDSVGPPSVGELHRLLTLRVPELIAYQNAGYAQSYADFVREVYQREQATCPGETRLSEAVARYLFKLMAYKDEYEVARLHMKGNVKDEMAAQFGRSAKYAYMLNPPLLRPVFKGKIKLGRWFEPMYSLLLRMKFLRGTPLDVFGYDEVRRTERSLPGEYRSLVEGALNRLSPQTYDEAVELAELPDMIRGYDHIKMGNVEKFRERAAEMQRA